jgi:hypothetical protein
VREKKRKKNKLVEENEIERDRGTQIRRHLGQWLTWKALGLPVWNVRVTSSS